MYKWFLLLIGYFYVVNGKDLDFCNTNPNITKLCKKFGDYRANLVPRPWPTIITPTVDLKSCLFAGFRRICWAGPRSGQGCSCCFRKIVSDSQLKLPTKIFQLSLLFMFPSWSVSCTAVDFELSPRPEAEVGGWRKCQIERREIFKYNPPVNTQHGSQPPRKWSDLIIFHPFPSNRLTLSSFYSS